MTRRFPDMNKPVAYHSLGDAIVAGVGFLLGIVGIAFLVTLMLAIVHLT